MGADEEQEETVDVELPLPMPVPAPPIAAAAAKAAPQAPAVQARAPETKPEPEPEPHGDDLSAITAALESDVFAEETQPGAGGVESEQSIDEVFATFRKHVEEEVDSKDFRTHYDLGIAYKVAMCYRDMGQVDRAIASYREAIELPGAEQDAMNGLRYELAELLLETGDGAGALELFLRVQQDDPSFREVGQRVERLQAEATG